MTVILNPMMPAELMAAMCLGSVIALLILWPEYTSKTVRRLASALMVALVVAGASALYAFPYPNPCDNCTSAWCVLLGCF